MALMLGAVFYGMAIFACANNDYVYFNTSEGWC